jgi:hypothetical protein
MPATARGGGLKFLQQVRQVPTFASEVARASEFRKRPPAIFHLLDLDTPD